MSTGNTSRVMGTYFAALCSGHFQQLLTEDVTWTTIQGGTEIKGSQAVEESVNGLRSRMFDVRTRQLAVTDGSATSKEAARVRTAAPASRTASPATSPMGGSRRYGPTARSPR